MKSLIAALKNEIYIGSLWMFDRSDDTAEVVNITDTKVTLRFKDKSEGTWEKKRFHNHFRKKLPPL